MESMSVEKLAVLELEYKMIDDANKLRANEIKVATNGLYLPNSISSIILSNCQNSRN